MTTASRSWSGSSPFAAARSSINSSTTQSIRSESGQQRSTELVDLVLPVRSVAAVHTRDHLLPSLVTGEVDAFESRVRIEDEAFLEDVVFTQPGKTVEVSERLGPERVREAVHEVLGHQVGGGVGAATGTRNRRPTPSTSDSSR